MKANRPSSASADDEAEFLAGDGEDEIGLRVRQQRP